MSEEQLPQENVQPGSTASSNPFPPQNGGFPPNNGGFGGNPGGFGGMQQQLPNATAVLILGILSILTCCCYGIVGVILAIVAMVLSKKDRALYEMNPAAYTEASYKNSNAGRVCAIVGLILSILYLIFIIGFIAFFGVAALGDKDAMMEAIQNMK